MNDGERDILDALIVRNLAKVNVALSRVWYGIGPKVYAAIDGASKRWVDAEGWKGKFCSADEGELWFAPPAWTVSGLHADSDGHYAYFLFDAIDDEDETEGGDQDRLVTLLGAGVGSMGIWVVRGLNGALAKPAWRRLASSSGVGAAMVALGFKYDDSGSYFLSIPFNAEDLAKGIETGDLSSFLAPLNEALGKLPAAVEAMRPVVDVASKPS
jgi:hypothetical protein